MALQQRQPGGQGRPPARRALHLDRAQVLLDDGVADRQPQPGALTGWFRGEKGLKDFSEVLWLDARAGVINLDDQLRRTTVRAVAGGGAQRQRTAVRHGLDRVQQYIEQHMFDVRAIQCPARRPINQALKPIGKRYNTVTDTSLPVA